MPAHAAPILPVPGRDGELRAARVRGYESERPDVMRHVPRDARNVLELGCSSGRFGEVLKRRQPARVVGFELDPAYAAEAATRLDHVVVGDVETLSAGDRPGDEPFDCLVAADVLEHLRDPHATLSRAVAWLAPGSTVVVSLPNVLWWKAWRRVLREQTWPRESQGIFDATHVSWFSLADAIAMLEGAGLTKIEVEPRFWTSPRRTRVYRLLYRIAAVRAFLPPQLLLVARTG